MYSWSKAHHLPFLACEAASFGVTNLSRQLDRLGEVQAHFTGRMRVRAEGDADISRLRKLEDLRAGINLFAILAQTGGVQFDGDMFLRRDIEELFKQRRAITLRVDAEFFRQIRVANDLKQARVRCAHKPIEIR